MGMLNCFVLFCFKQNVKDRLMGLSQSHLKLQTSEKQTGRAASISALPPDPVVLSRHSLAPRLGGRTPGDWPTGEGTSRQHKGLGG